jgi:hypothetical protein
MKTVHENLEPKEFPESEFVAEYFYCAETGQLATEMCPNKLKGYYKTNYSLPLACISHPGNGLPEVDLIPPEMFNPDGTLKLPETPDTSNPDGTTPDDNGENSTPDDGASSTPAVTE